MIDEILEEYKEEYDDTPWYHNTANCQLEGKMDMLKLIKKGINQEDFVFDDAEVGCYLGGAVTAIESLKHELIYGWSDEDE